jgi:hypothetical protein
MWKILLEEMVHRKIADNKSENNSSFFAAVIFKILNMRFLLLMIILFYCLFFTACDSDNKDIFNTEVVKLKASISNISETILLGDTLRIALKLPDTVTSNTGVYLVQSLRRGNFPMYINKVDTINKRADLVQMPAYWTEKGAIEGNFSFVLNTNVKPYEVIINLKPASKGLYYLEVISQPGNLKINNNYDARLIVDFDVADKHYNLLRLISPYFGGQVFYDAFIKRESDGYGNYFFRVN